MKWLLLTDFHTGKPDHQTQQDAFADLVTNIAREEGALDGIVLAGDIAYSGQATEYKAFADGLLTPLLRLPQLRNATLLAVPGNHDVDCDRVDPASWKGLGEARRGTFFEESSRGVSARCHRAPAFTDFESFAHDHNIIAPIPSERISFAHVLSVGDRRIRFVLTNTAFFATKEPDLRQDGNTPAPTASLRSVLGKTTDKYQCTLVVGHHPIADFVYEHREPFKTLLVEHEAIYVHGHAHQLSAEHTAGGLLSLGFGAAYPASLDAPANPHYRNSFAICTWDGGLSVRLHNWDGVHGRWAITTEVPSGFVPKPGSAGQYFFPARSALGRTKQPATAAPLRNPPSCEGIALLPDTGSKDLLDILRAHQLVPGLDRNIEYRVISSAPGMLVIQYSTPAGQCRIKVVTASGQLFTREDVEETNNEIDYEALAGSSVLTTGELAPDARTSYVRLQARKPLTILDHRELAAGLLRGSALEKHIETLDSAVVDIQMLVRQGALVLLVYEKERSGWFYVVQSAGQVEPESSAIVKAVREMRPRFAMARYGGPVISDTPVSTPHAALFDRHSYLEGAHREFNAVKYAALASFGFRFSAITLDELYVNASATEASASEAAVAKAVDEALQGLRLPDALRLQLENQLRRVLKTGRHQETSEARRLYQRHDVLLVLGDPGSGKTFFAKHELLSYCRPGEDSWYALHLPVYLALSEVAHLIGDKATDEEIDLFAAAETLAARRGLGLPRDVLADLAASGRVAFFFDGLDEVASLEHRSRIFGAVCRVARDAQASGNRVIVTSRPAAIRLVEVPEALRKVVLKGLSESEMRTLAHRILAARVAEGGDAVHLDQAELTPSDIALVERIVADCAASPGIRRLAQNPLLFTLLIMIYANSGAPAAKRHRVYQQAVQTLATSRSRESGHKAFSESDLRRRLGAVALSVFRDSSATVPRWDDSIEVLRSVIAAEKGGSATATASDAENFLQQVGEGTGLVIPHRDATAADGGNITFMHYSFLEYYAAVGLALEPDPNTKAAEVARVPRWREVILLYAGIIADQNDITLFIQALLQAPNAIERVALSKLELAVDCALESEVPADTVHTVLLGAFASAASTSLRKDGELRAKFGALLARLYAASRSDQIVEFLRRGLEAGSTEDAPVYLELTGAVFRDADAPPAIKSAFEKATLVSGSPILIATCEAIAICPELRTQPALARYKKAFAGSAAARFAAARAAERAPELARDVWGELLKILREDPAYIAVTAANAILRAGWRLDLDSQSGRADMVRALRCLLQFGLEEHVRGIGDAVDQSDVDTFLTSPEQEKRTMGVCLLPWVRGAERYVHERIMNLILSKDIDHAIKVIALGAMRLSPDAQRLMKVADLDAIYGLLYADTRDVRAAAARLVGHIHSEEQSAAALQRYAAHCKQEHESEEYRAAVRALGEGCADMPPVQQYVEAELVERLDISRTQTEATRRELLELLQLPIQGEWVGTIGLINRLKMCVQNDRWTGDVRGAALVCLGWLWEPSEESVDFFVGLLENGDQTLHSAKAEAIWRFALRCKRRVNYVRAVSHRLDRLLAAATGIAAGIPGSQEYQADFSMLRRAVEEVSSIKSAYEEYAARKGALSVGS